MHNEMNGYLFNPCISLFFGGELATSALLSIQLCSTLFTSFKSVGIMRHGRTQNEATTSPSTALFFSIFYFLILG